MTDDRTKRVPQDSTRINIHEDYEVRYWTGVLGVSADELRKTVASVA